MENIVVTFIANSVEAKQFGMNTSTFWATGAGLVTLVQSYGSYNLVDTIHKNKSGEGVSVYMLGYWHALMLCFVYYAWNAHSLAMMWNGVVLAPLYTVTLFAVFRYKAIRQIDILKIVIPLLVMPYAFIVTEKKDVLLLSFMIIGLLFFLDQTRLLYAEKRVGSFDPRFTLAIMLSSIFWFFFALSVRDFALTMFNPLVLAISLVTLHAYVRARRYEGLVRS